MLTVVIPVYNAEKWLSETLRSVLAQNYPQERYEIILVDDGSEDCSVTVARGVLKGTRVSHQLIEIGKNTGPSHARNVGWMRGTGAWVQFLDADDLLHPEKMAVQAEAAASLSEDVAVAYSSWQSLNLVDREWIPSEPVRSPVVDDDPLSELLKSEGFVHTGSALYRKVWLERVGGFDERHTLIEDVDLMLRIAMAGGEFCRVEGNQPLFFYRRHAGGLSQQDRRGFIEGCIRNADLVEGYCREQEALTAAKAQAIASVYYQAARQFAERDRDRFRDMTQKLEGLCPGFRPEGPRPLRWLSGLVGYPRAEIVAVAWRKAKRVLGQESPAADDAQER